jgi:hypothetical protein
MHVPDAPGFKQAKPGAQSALLAQLVLHVVPVAGQVKLLAHARGAGNLQLPALHVPGSTTLGDEQLELPQLTVEPGNEQVPLLWHVPSQAAKVFVEIWQPLLSQQLPLGMHRPSLQTLKPLIGQVQTPAPVQVKLVPHDVAAGAMQAPLEQVPAPTLLFPEQVGALHPLVVG